MASEGTSRPATEFGSDVIAALLRAFDIPALAINPGASFRGLHDSIVNYLGNKRPSLLLTLHESQAVAIAHGYAKVTGNPMGVVLHANVGLMNAVMAIYDAYVDRMPMLILGATGVVDAAKRRPWIEWIHTSRDQGALVRSFVKWDDQPASIEAAVESLCRAMALTTATPQAPTYVCLDVELQESPLPAGRTVQSYLPDVARLRPAPGPVARAGDLDAAKVLIEKARRPLVLIGRHRRTDAAWAARIRFVEAAGAVALCDQKCGVGFPSAHAAFVGAPAQYLDARAKAALEQADAIVSLDWPDVAGTLSQRADRGENVPTLILSPDERLHNGWSFDHFGFAQADIRLAVHPDDVLPDLTARLAGGRAPWPLPRAEIGQIPTSGAITLPALARVFDAVRGARRVSLVRLPFGWPDAATRFTGPLDCLGYDGGGGIGSTPGIAIGAALALKGSGRTPVAILGDGDLLMGSQALWTAAAEKLPVLFLVNNNRSFFNDVEHQERVARRRGRPLERRDIGMAIDNPAIDLPALARACGFTVFGPLTKIEELEGALETAFRAVEAGAAVLVDVSVPAPGLTP